MNLYAESSAVLAWLLDEPRAGEVESILNGATRIIASVLTLVECERVLVRSRVTGTLRDFEAAQRRSQLEEVSSEWIAVDLKREILSRAGQRFPAEPLRTLDALHLASALTAKVGIPDLALLSLDSRVRTSGEALGFDVLPR
jgi:predicted nucleic acid-binding protein